MKKEKRLVARVPDSVHQALKVKLAQEGKSIQEFIEEKVKEYLKK